MEHAVSPEAERLVSKKSFRPSWAIADMAVLDNVAVVDDADIVGVEEVEDAPAPACELEPSQPVSPVTNNMQISWQTMPMFQWADNLK